MERETARESSSKLPESAGKEIDILFCFFFSLLSHRHLFLLFLSHCSRSSQSNESKVIHFNVDLYVHLISQDNYTANANLSTYSIYFSF